MGHAVSCLCRESDEDENNESFEEVERRKSRDERGKDDLHRRRRSSGLSRYSTEFQHVIESPLKIAAFNVKRFGSAKMKDDTVVDILGKDKFWITRSTKDSLKLIYISVKIILQFDIILMQEIVDTSERAIKELVKCVNSAIVDGEGDSCKFDLQLSPRIGRSSQKEQYAFLYR